MFPPYVSAISEMRPRSPEHFLKKCPGKQRQRLQVCAAAETGLFIYPKRMTDWFLICNARWTVLKGPLRAKHKPSPYHKKISASHSFRTKTQLIQTQQSQNSQQGWRLVTNKDTVNTNNNRVKTVNRADVWSRTKTQLTQTTTNGQKQSTGLTFSHSQGH